MRDFDIISSNPTDKQIEATRQALLAGFHTCKTNHTKVCIVDYGFMHAVFVMVPAVSSLGDVLRNNPMACNLYSDGGILIACAILDNTDLG